MKHPVTLIEGDGIGPEISRAVVRVLEATGVEIEWHVHEAGAAAVEQYGTQLPEVVLQSIRNDRVALKGPVTTPIGTGFRSANVALRKDLDLYACLRPVKSLPGVPSRYSDIDLIVVRENTEDLYSSLEHTVVPGVVESIKIITERASSRIAEFAFQHARRAGRHKVTAVHKANIMKLSDGLFLDCCRAVAARYPDIQYNEAIVDAACMQLVLDPWRFDVLLNENLYGDILSDLCAGLAGGLGVVPGANLGPDCAVFEAVHGSAPDIAGKDLANPTAMLLSACMMLDHLGEEDAADRTRSAIDVVLRESKHVTRDLGGSASTTEMADAIIDALVAKAPALA
jgi:isocitrate dehydrogenase (NAD+)